MSLATIRSIIEQMPATEIKYYLLLLIRSLNDHHLKTGPFVEQFKQFTDEINALMILINSPRDSSADNIPTQFEAIHVSYQKLLNLSKTKTIGIQIGYMLLQVIGAIGAVLCGIIGGVIGGVAGFSRGLWNISNPFKSAWIGFVMGLALGGIVGFRAPKKLAKDEFIRQLKYCLDGIGECIKKTQEQADEPLSSYEKIVTDKYFGGCSENFNTFRGILSISQGKRRIILIATSHEPLRMGIF